MAPTATVPDPTNTGPTPGSVAPEICDPRAAIAGLVGQVRQLLEGIDPDEVLARHAPGVWDLLDEGAKLFTGAQTRIARRVADSRVHKDAGAKTTSEYLAVRSGMSNQAAAEMLATSTHLRGLPTTETAVRSGQLSVAQAHRVSDAAIHNPSREQHLLGVARQASLKELRDAALRAKHEADPDPEATRRRQHRDRCFRQGNTADGGWWFSGRGKPEDAGRFNAGLNPLIENTFRQARNDGRHEPREAYAYDAVMEMARQARHNPTATAPQPDEDPPTESSTAEERGGAPDQGSSRTSSVRPVGQLPTPGVEPAPGATPVPRRYRPSLSLLPVLRLDLPAVHRGRLAAGELCEITSVGPVSLTAARELVEEAVVKLVLTNAGRVVTVTHIGRAPPNPTYLAILHADLTGLADQASDERPGSQPTCTIPGLGDLPEGTARELLGQLAGIDLLDQVLARGRDVAGLVHPGRQPTTAQRVALLWAQPTCSVTGCPHTFTQIDHRHDWHKNQVTELDNLDRLCPTHHRLKTTSNFRLIPGTGDRELVPPTDPRHPDAAPCGSRSFAGFRGARQVLRAET